MHVEYLTDSNQLLVWLINFKVVLIHENIKIILAVKWVWKDKFSPCFRVQNMAYITA
jgi:hypothetical protein